MKLLFRYTKEEFIETFDPSFIAETWMRGSSPTQTFSGKRKFDECFKISDVEAVKNLVRKAKNYYTKGVPEEITLDSEEFRLWTTLKCYCERVVFNT